MRPVFAALLLLLPVAWVPGAAAATTERALLQDMVSGVRAAIRALPAAQRPPGADTLLTGPLERLRIGGTQLPLAVVARVPRPQMTTLGAHADAVLRDDVEAIREAWNLGGLADSVEAHAPTGVYQRASDAVEAYGDVLLEQAIRDTDRWLHAFEVKYGDGSPRLNLAEVVANGLLQHLGAFQPNDDGPSRNEVVIAYQTTWATRVDDQAHALSVFETGLRRYNFDWQPDGHDDWTRLLRPRYWTVGALVASGRDGALLWPLEGASEGETRAGPFLSWGDVKIAVILGPEKRFIVSRQWQLLPGLF